MLFFKILNVCNKDSSEVWIWKRYFRHFSIIWALRLGAQTGILVSKTLWLCHCIWSLLSKWVQGLSLCKIFKWLYRWEAVAEMVQEDTCSKNKAYTTKTPPHWWAWFSWNKFNAFIIQVTLFGQGRRIPDFTTTHTHKYFETTRCWCFSSL